MIKKKKPVSSPFVGNYKTLLKGRGIEFSDFNEYQFGDDIKNIDFIRSLREGKTLLRRYEEERELNIYFIIDISDTLYFSSGGDDKRATLLKNFKFLSNVALKNNDKIGMLLSGDKNYDFFPAKKGLQYNQYLYQKILLKAPHTQKDIFQKALDYFITLPQKNTLVFLFTDKQEEISNKTLKVLSLKHELIYVNIFDILEHSLSQIAGIYDLGLSGNKNLLFSFRNNKKIELYNQMRSEKIKLFSQKLASYDIGYILLDNTKNPGKEWSKFFHIR